MNLITRDNHVRAHYMFPGQVYNAQELRRRTERKFRERLGLRDRPGEWGADAHRRITVRGGQLPRGYCGRSRRQVRVRRQQRRQHDFRLYHRRDDRRAAFDEEIAVSER